MSIQDIAAKGRYGDTHLLHVSDAEVQGLNALANDIYGHGLTTNPDTGLPEAFLFAPFLAPMVAGGLGFGGTALATGLTAGALGTAEAAARGMDDPLQQGLMAGLTAGAGQAIGNSLQGMGEAANAAPIEAVNSATEAVANPMANQAMGGATGQGLDLTGQAIQAPSVGFNAGPSTMPSINPTLDAAGGLSTTGVGQGAYQLPGSGMDFSTNMGAGATTGTSVGGGAPVYEGGTNISQMTSPAQPAPTTDMFNTTGISPMEMELYPELAPQASTGSSFTQNVSDYASGLPDRFSDIGAGAEKAFGSQEGFKQFIGENQIPLAAGALGITGQEALENQQEARESYEAAQGEKRAEYDKSVADIKANYAAAGIPMPYDPESVFTGPGFAQGRTVTADEEERRKEVMERYREQTAEEPWYTRLPVQVLDKLGISDPSRVRRAEKDLYGMAAGGYLEGGIASLKGDGMSDSVPAQIDGSQPAALSTGEYVIPADVVSHLGNGSSDDGAVRLDEMLDRVRVARTGTEKQAPQIKAEKYMPA